MEDNKEDTAEALVGMQCVMALANLENVQGRRLSEIVSYLLPSSFYHIGSIDRVDGV